LRTILTVRYTGIYRWVSLKDDERTGQLDDGSIIITLNCAVVHGLVVTQSQTTGKVITHN